MRDINRINNSMEEIKNKYETAARSDYMSKEEIEIKCLRSEVERYHDMTQEILNYIGERQMSKELYDIYSIIKKWAG